MRSWSHRGKCLPIEFLQPFAGQLKEKPWCPFADLDNLSSCSFAFASYTAETITAVPREQDEPDTHEQDEAEKYEHIDGSHVCLSVDGPR